MRSLSILLSIPAGSDPNSGAAGALIAIANELRRYGHRVEVVSLDALPRWIQSLPKSITVRLKPLIFPWWLCTYFYRRARAFDVIDMHTGGGWLLFTLLRATTSASQRPLLVTSSLGLEHSSYNDLKGHMRWIRWSLNPLKVLSSIYDSVYTRYWSLWQVKRSCQLSDLCFFLNRTEAKVATAAFSINSHNIVIAPNGLPACLLNIPRPSGGALDKIGVAQLGAFRFAKGYHLSIPAMTKVMISDERVFFRLLGTGLEDRDILAYFPEELRSRIQNIRYYERCQLPELLRDCEITIFPSLTEGFGMGLLEAMACHLAPVSSASAGPRDIITSPDEGVLVPVGDAVALQGAIVSLLEDASLRDQIRNRAHQRAQAFPWTRIVKERASAYSEFLGRVR